MNIFKRKQDPLISAFRDRVNGLIDDKFSLVTENTRLQNENLNLRTQIIFCEKPTKDLEERSFSLEKRVREFSDFLTINNTLHSVRVKFKEQFPDFPSAIRTRKPKVKKIKGGKRS